MHLRKSRSTGRAGVGLVVVLSVAGTVAGLSCYPGVLPPCEEPSAEYPYCWEPGSAVDASSSDTAVVPDTGGPPETNDEGGGVTSATRLEGCAAYPTVGDIEAKLFRGKCGLCHPLNEVSPLDFKSPDLFKRLMADTTDKLKGPQTKCAGEKYVSASDHTKSYLYSTVRDAEPKCESGKRGGDQMGLAGPKSKLPMADIDCVGAYVKVLSEALKR